VTAFCLLAGDVMPFSHAQPTRAGGRNSVFGFFRRASDQGGEPAKVGLQAGRNPAPIAEEQQASSASDMPATQPAVSRAQAIQRISGWLTSTATTAGEQPKQCVCNRNHPAVTSGCLIRTTVPSSQNGALDTGERLGVAAARGATAIQRLTGAEKYQVHTSPQNRRSTGCWKCRAGRKCRLSRWAANWTG
jgi:hypothetical protein